MEEVKQRYWWVEDLVNSDAKAMGTYLTMLFFIGPLRLVMYSIRDKPSGASGREKDALIWRIQAIRIRTNPTKIIANHAP